MVSVRTSRIVIEMGWFGRRLLNHQDASKDVADTAMSEGTTPFAPYMATRMMLTIVPSTPPAIHINARSAIRRVPAINAPWPSETRRRNTATESAATAPACSFPPNVRTDTGLASPTSKTAPRSPRPIETRRSTRAVRTTRSVCPEPTASPTWRTPLVFTPKPAMLLVSSMIDVYAPISPTPPGPRRIAIALVRTMPTRMLTTDDPPISTVDLRISR